MSEDYFFSDGGVYEFRAPTRSAVSLAEGPTEFMTVEALSAATPRSWWKRFLRLFRRSVPDA